MKVYEWLLAQGIKPAHIATVGDSAGGNLCTTVVLGIKARGLALPAATAFASPLGAIDIDADAVAAIAGLPQVSVRADAHTDEHCLEVQLPFLQAVLGTFRLLPLLVGEATAAEVAEVLDTCLLYTSPSPRDRTRSRMPSSA